MNYLELTHDQIESIQRVYPLFDSDEIQYRGSVRNEDGFPLVSSLEICLNDTSATGWGWKWASLIESDYEVEDYLFKLSDQQYIEVREHLVKQAKMI